jgi:SAM-dependent methyltransferase
MSRQPPPRWRRTLRQIHANFTGWELDPVALFRRVRALPHYFRNAAHYRRLNRRPNFSIRVGEALYKSYDRYSPAGTGIGHYFHQDLWAARHVLRTDGGIHVDVASRLDGFVAQVLARRPVIYVDIRPLRCNVAGLEYRRGSLLELPFPDGSVSSLSCLHVIEHIGLGRYGDKVDPAADLAGAAELGRVLAPGGMLLVGTPVGVERMCFDAHRVYDPSTIQAAFAGLTLKEFSLIDDAGFRVIENADFDLARRCSYGCGLFRFTKP